MLDLTETRDGRIIAVYNSKTGDSTNVTYNAFQILNPREPTIQGTSCDDVIIGRLEASVIYGLEGNDQLLGMGHDDTLVGGIGDDIPNGGSGADTMVGGANNDRFFVDYVADTVVETAGGGSDYILASTTYALRAGAEVERLSTTKSRATTAINLAGNEFAQRIDGNQSNNKLSSLYGNDTIYELGGNDALYGGDGKDALVGGLGNDAFVFDTALNASTNVDIIGDFSNLSGNNDTIRLAQAIFTTLPTGALASNLFKANATGTAADADDRIAYETDTGKLFYDSDGSGAGGSVLFAVLKGTPTITASDFLVV